MFQLKSRGLIKTLKLSLNKENPESTVLKPVLQIQKQDELIDDTHRPPPT